MLQQEAAMSLVTGVISLAGFMQVPLLVDILRIVNPRLRISRTTGKIMTILLVVSMALIGLVALIFHYFIFLPIIVPNPLQSWCGWCHIAFALWVWINMSLNYLYCVFTDPGYTTVPGANVDENGDPVDPDDPVFAGDFGVGNVMNNLQYDETKEKLVGSNVDPHDISDAFPVDYCVVCRRHIIYMDHHCPFIGSCAGIHNYSYFLLFVIYSLIGLLYALTLTSSYFIKCFFTAIIAFWQPLSIRDPPVCRTLGTNAAVVIPVMGGLVPLGVMTIAQIILLLADLSTRDFLRSLRYPNWFNNVIIRIKEKRWRHPASKLNILLLKQRRHFLFFLIPVWRKNLNINDYLPPKYL